MMKNSWLPPEPLPFSRLNIRDGLLIDANKWRLEHGYLRKRQSYHYQSLNQAGIVCGLEVRIIEPPSTVRPEYRTRRWIEISAGVAIDHQGNIIIVPEARKYRIDGTVPPQKPSQTIYIVIRYRDPDDLHGTYTKEILTEQFRLDEKSEPPTLGEVEVCRFELLPSEVELQAASNVFYPGYNALDLRYRPVAQWRSQGMIKTAMYNCPNPEQSGLFLLLSSLRGIYSFLEGSKYIDDTFLTPEEENELLDNDLLSVSESQFCSLEGIQIEEVSQYIKAGGTVLIDGTLEDSHLALLDKSKQELSGAIAKIADLSVFAERQEELQQELNQISQDFDKKLQTIQDITRKIGSELTHWNFLPTNHPLKIEPFLFAVPPTINEYQNQIWLGEGIILILGNLSSAWALAPNLSLSREILRNAQEMGVNILHYAWRRKLLTSLQKASVTPLTPATPITTPTTPTTPLRTPLTPKPPVTPINTSLTNVTVAPGEVETPVIEEIEATPVIEETEENKENESEIVIATPTTSSEKRKRPKPSDLF